MSYLLFVLPLNTKDEFHISDVEEYEEVKITVSYVRLNGSKGSQVFSFRKFGERRVTAELPDDFIF
jgi:hypothetical protein